MKHDLRERTHEMMRAELAAAALDLIIEKGYEEQTADDLAQGLGISRATFFRYFGSKDEVVVAAMLGPAEQFSDSLAGDRPQASQWQKLRAAFEPAVVMAEISPERIRARIQLIKSLPALGARLHRARQPQVDCLAEALRNQGHEPFTARILATASIAVLDQCWMQWAQDESSSLRNILDQAFVCLETAAAIAMA